MNKCEKSQDGTHRITTMPMDIIKVYKGEMSLEEYKKGQFCTLCGEAIW